MWMWKRLLNDACNWYSTADLYLATILTITIANNDNRLNHFDVCVNKIYLQAINDFDETNRSRVHDDNTVCNDAVLIASAPHGVLAPFACAFALPQTHARMKL